MIRIQPEHIYLLRNSTGKPLTDLLDRLIRSSAAIAGIPPSAVLDNPRTNHPDGGVDTQVDGASISDPTGYFALPSAWQYKAVALAGFSDSKVKEEIAGESKTYIRDLLKRGYAYRMCVADDLPAERKTEIKHLLDEEIKKVNSEAPEALVLFASDIHEWVNKFPAIAASMLGSSLTDFFHFKTWQNRERALTKTFVSTAESAVIFDQVKSHLCWQNRPGAAALTVSGDAGVGKSRTVFEAIAALPEIASLVLYTDDEDKALDLARAVANQPDLYAVIVADECLEPTAYQLARLLQGVEQRARLVTIDNALESSRRSELRLKRMSEPTVEKIVAENFPGIDGTRRYQYCRIAEGYLRFAVFLCHNDALIVQQGHLGNLLADTKGYLRTLFGEHGPFEAADYEALMVISLVERCGVIDNLYSELESLCNLVTLNPKSVRDRLHSMQKKNGLIARAGRYFYVTPTPVAIACFHDAWSKWAELDPKGFLQNFPMALVPRFQSRVARAPEEVGNVVNDYFRARDLSRGADIFADADDTEQFLLRVRSSPEEMIPRLRTMVVAAQPAQLSGRLGGRRRLVVEAGEIAAFPRWFAFAEEMLFTLALHESEPGFGNNASEVWAGLFQLVSYVATPFSERLKILRNRIGNGGSATKTLCVEALSTALDSRSVYMTTRQPYGNRVAPGPWRPQTREELYGYIAECLQELNALCSDWDQKVREKAGSALVKSIRTLVLYGLVRQAKEGVGVIPSFLRPVLRAELREFALLNQSEHSPYSEDERKLRAESVEQWITELASSNIHDRLVEEVRPSSWEHQLERSAWESRIREIASQLLLDEAAFDEELPWLSSDSAGSSVDFGIKLGELDDGLKLLDRTVLACRTSRNPNFARGYFLGVTQTTAPQLPSAEAETVQHRLNVVLDDLWTQDPVLAFHVATPSGDFVHSFRRAITAVRDKSIPAELLHNFVAWNGTRHTSPSEVRQAAETLLASAIDGDREAANTGIELIAFLLMREGERPDQLHFLKLVFEDESVGTIFGLLEEAVSQSEKLSDWFDRVFALGLHADPARATSVLVRMVQSDSYEVTEAATKLFAAAAAACPRDLMESVGRVLLSKEPARRFLFRKLPIAVLPADTVTAWVDEYGLEGARSLARHLPRPTLGPNGPELNPITWQVLEKFGGDDIVFTEWHRGGHDGKAFWGSLADHYERKAAEAEQFLNFPLEPVRRWAKLEISFAEQNVPSFRLGDEERF